jgi:septal ring factor EnvC (AmiA/AmiB activator)
MSLTVEQRVSALETRCTNLENANVALTNQLAVLAGQLTQLSVSVASQQSQSTQLQRIADCLNQMGEHDSHVLARQATIATPTANIWSPV